MSKSKRLSRLSVDNERTSLVEKINARFIFNSEQGIPDGDDNELQQLLADLVLYDRKIEELRDVADLELTREQKSYSSSGRDGRTALQGEEEYSDSDETYWHL